MENTGPEEDVDIIKATENEMTSLLRVFLLPLKPSLEKLTPILQDMGQAGREKEPTDLSSEESTHSNDT